VAVNWGAGWGIVPVAAAVDDLFPGPSNTSGCRHELRHHWHAGCIKDVSRVTIMMRLIPSPVIASEALESAWNELSRVLFETFHLWPDYS